MSKSKKNIGKEDARLEKLHQADFLKFCDLDYEHLDDLHEQVVALESLCDFDELTECEDDLNKFMKENKKNEMIIKKRIEEICSKWEEIDDDVYWDRDLSISNIIRAVVHGFKRADDPKQIEKFRHELYILFGSVAETITCYFEV